MKLRLKENMQIIQRIGSLTKKAKIRHYFDSKRGKRYRFNKIKNPKTIITTESNKIQNIIRNYYENISCEKLDNTEETEDFSDIASTKIKSLRHK